MRAFTVLACLPNLISIAKNEAKKRVKLILIRLLEYYKLTRKEYRIQMKMQPGNADYQDSENDKVHSFLNMVRWPS